MAQLITMRRPADPENFIHVEVPVDSPFSTEGSLNHDDIAAFNPKIKDWIRTDLLETVYLAVTITKTAVAEPRSSRSAIVFSFSLYFASLNDATMFKLKWM